MASVSDQAIVIRLWDFSETSQTVSLFCRELGVVRGLAKGSKRADARFSGGFDLVTRGSVQAIIKPGEGLATITGWDLLEVFPAVRASLGSFYAAMAMADVVHHAVRDQDPHPALFDGLLEGLRVLGAAESGAVGVLRVLWVALMETGYRPELERDIRDPSRELGEPGMVVFMPQLGGFTVGAAGSDGWRVRGETLRMLRAVAEGSAPVAGFGPAVVARGVRLLSAYFGVVTGTQAAGLGEFVRLIGTGIGSGAEVRIDE